MKECKIMNSLRHTESAENKATLHKGTQCGRSIVSAADLYRANHLATENSTSAVAGSGRVWYNRVEESDLAKGTVT